MSDNDGHKIIDGSLTDILNSTEQNIYSVTFKNNFELNNNSLFENVDIIEHGEKTIKVNLNEIQPQYFIKSISKEFEITEFRKINPSLHQLFLNLVQSK